MMQCMSIGVPEGRGNRFSSSFSRYSKSSVFGISINGRLPRLKISHITTPNDQTSALIVKFTSDLSTSIADHLVAIKPDVKCDPVGRHSPKSAICKGNVDRDKNNEP